MISQRHVHRQRFLLTLKVDPESQNDPDCQEDVDGDQCQEEDEYREEADLP